MSSMDIKTVHEQGSTPRAAVAKVAQSLGAYRVYAYSPSPDGRHSSYKFCCSPQDEDSLKHGSQSHRVTLVWDRGQWVENPDVQENKKWWEFWK
jgi:hypothetical protein